MTALNEKNPAPNAAGAGFATRQSNHQNKHDVNTSTGTTDDASDLLRQAQEVVAGVLLTVDRVSAEIARVAAQ